MVLGMTCLTGCRVREVLLLLLLLVMLTAQQQQNVGREVGLLPPGRGGVREGGPVLSLLLQLLVMMRGVTLTPMPRLTLLLLDPCLSSLCRWAVCGTG
jgi:hypothetical protein